jgi:hypothetical protein
MDIPSEITNLVTQLNQELEITEQDARNGLKLLREIMSRFPSNAVLIEFFAYFNAALFFVENARIRIQSTTEQLSDTNIETIEEIGENLATLLGEVIETKIRGRNLLDRLENLR